MSTCIPCWKLRSSLLDSSLLGSLSLLGEESLSWSRVFFFFDLTVDGDGCLLFLIIGLEGSYSEWSESEAAGGVAGRASSWATGGFWASLWWRRKVKKWRKQSCQCQERVSERRLAHHLKFSAPQTAESSVEQEAWVHSPSPSAVMVASLSQCAKGWQPEPCIGHQLQWWQNYEWSTVLVIKACDFVKNPDLLQLYKNRFLTTAYLDNKCKHYTRLMFLIQEMLIVMAVKDIKKSVPCIQQVPRHKEYQWSVLKPVKKFFLENQSNPPKNKH